MPTGAPGGAERKVVGYTVAAYALVIGSLAWYGWRVQKQRRELMRRRNGDPTGERKS